MLITWDEPKRRSNLDKHGIDFAEIDEDFFASAIVWPARNGRLQAVGRHQSVTILVVYARLGAEGIAIVSARRASRAERELLNA